jgi:chromosome partitioning protein
MADLVIACLSQKGGVGKSTLSRMIATAYAEHNMRVGIMDFNGKQQTSIDWAETRERFNIEPPVRAELATQANRLRTNKQFDVIVADGKPDSPDITLSIALVANLIVIPTSVSIDDLRPQVKFARELVERGVKASRIIFVVNRHTDNQSLIQDAYDYIGADFKVAERHLPYRDVFIRCHNGGHSIGEVRKAVLGNVGALAETTAALALEIATTAQEME